MLRERERSDVIPMFSEVNRFWLMQLDATGRPDESLAVEFVGPLNPNSEDNSPNGKLLSCSLQKGQLKANICFQPFHSANLEVHEFINFLLTDEK